MVSRAKKQFLVDRIAVTLSSNSIVVVLKNCGITANELSALRMSLKRCDNSFGLMVVKNSLFYVAAKSLDSGSKYESLDLVNSNIIAYSNDLYSLLKVLYAFSKSSKRLEFLSCYCGDTLLSAKDIVVIASLPSVEFLYYKLGMAIKSPANRLYRDIKYPIQKLAMLLNHYVNK